MARITGSSTIDWSSVTFDPLNVASDFNGVENLLFDLLNALNTGQATLISFTASRLEAEVHSFQVQGRVVITGANFFAPDPDISTVKFTSSTDAEKLTLNAVSETLTYRPPSGSHTLIVDEQITIRDAGHSITFSGGGDPAGPSGYFNAVTISGPDGTITITGLKKIPFSAVQGVDSPADFFTVLAPHLTGNDTISYNSSVGITLDGGAGNDTISGGTGADTLVGGVGDDRFTLTSLGSDTIVENEGEGSDTVRLAFNVASPTLVDLSGFDNVENLEAVGTGAFNLTGDDAGNALLGNASANVLEGGAGNDRLDGKGGADAMTGGTGDDLFVLDRAADTVTELAGGGSDTVQLAYTAPTVLNLGLLFANVEGLKVTGTRAYQLIGTAADNTLGGNSADNLLDGGAGNDDLAGGAGNDTYLVDSADDVIVEGVRAGTDTVRSTASSYQLSPNVERLLLLGNAQTGIGNASANTITGTSGNDTLEGAGGNDTLRGGAGDDLYIVGIGTDAMVESATGGHDTVQSAASVSIAALPFLEDVTLTGSANVNATGNSAVNVLIGNAGDNTLDGRGGVDTMSGGLGNDRYVIDRLDDLVNEAAGQGSDTVRIAFNVTGATLIEVSGFQNIENLEAAGTGAFSLTGDAGDNVLVGNASANTLDGGAGNDILDGRGGADTLIGGAGNDLFIVDRASDTVTELSGIDTVRLAYSVDGATTIHLGVLYGGQVENAHVTGAGAFRLFGNAGDNVLTGNASANILDGGAGNDTLAGGAGNDTYFVDSAGDVVIEAAKGGADTVRSSVSFTLSANVENLVLTGTGLTGIGNASANVMTGTGGDDTLEGGGGNDSLRGGLGNDTYVVGVGTDTIVEAAGGGVDTVQSTGSVSIAALSQLENVTLLGSANVNATGNAGANVLTGNIGNNTLDGRGGGDTLSGGLGDDRYILRSLSDVVNENPGGGDDTVVIAFNVTTPTPISLALFANVEHLEILGTGGFSMTGTAGDDILVGNGSANTLDGGAGNDTLDGRGGADTLIGGTGNDIFVLDRATDVVVENAGEGDDLVRVGYNVTTATTIQLAANVESIEVTGTGVFNLVGDELDNTLIGNASANTLTGGAGNDTLDGRGGADTLVGGLGNDVFVIDRVSDVVTEAADQGDDTLHVAFDTVAVTTIDLGTSYANVENVQVSGSGRFNLVGNAGDNLLAGNSADNALSGGGGNDTLDGGVGGDTMSGGTGDDLYVFDSVWDRANELPGEGTDTILVDYNATGTITINLAVSSAEVEQASVVGAGSVYLIGNALDNELTANDAGSFMAGMDGDDTLIGGAGNDALDGDFGDDSLTGGAGNDELNGGFGNDSMAGGTGDDTYRMSSAADVVVESAGAGHDLIIGAFLDYALPENVEDLQITGGNSNITGNALDNAITTNFGDDVLDGGAGHDTLQGGSGNDRYIVDSEGDVVVEGISEGAFNADTVVSSLGHYALGANVERLELAAGSADLDGTGNGLNNTLTGNSGDNELAGLDGNDSLNGGAGNDVLDGGSGNDTMIGGDGDDHYLVDAAADVVSETSLLGGVDSVLITYDAAAPKTIDLDVTFGGGVENVQIDGAGSFHLKGNAADNNLVGNAADNTFDGRAGVDTMTGGAGNDSYVVNLVADVVIEEENEGHDSVLVDSSAISGAFVLADHVEDLTLNDAAVDGTGNALDNEILGGRGNNVLTGLGGDDYLDGGRGTDTLAGGSGNDVYVVGSDGSDASFTVEGDGFPFIGTASFNSDDDNFSWFLQDWSGDGLADHIHVTVEDWRLDFTTRNVGGSLAPGHYDNAVRYLLDGPGQAGIDLVVGSSGAGNASGEFTIVAAEFDYSADDPELITFSIEFDYHPEAGPNTIHGILNINYPAESADTVVELADEGIDTVQSSVSYVLPDNVENLMLTGSADIDGTGNALDNALTGNDGNNVLDGGAGNDSFVFGDALNAVTNVDTISDFASGLDRLILDDAIFSALGAGALDADAFASGADMVAGADATDRIIYDTTTGDLYYDADGVDGAAAVKFATLTGAPSLAATDFEIV